METSEDERSMCFQADEFNNFSMNMDSSSLRERVSSRRCGVRQEAARRLELHESRIDELEYEGVSDTLDS